MKLFKVTTVVPEFDGCKDVEFIWFRSDVRPHGPQPRPYADLIKNYDPRQDDNARPGTSMSFYAEDYVESLFTEAEAKQLKAYIDRTIAEAQLPVPNNVIGVGAIPVGGGNDHYILHKEPQYSLSFEVMGYFDLRGCELVDGSGVHHGYHFVLTSDGEMRKAMNPPPRDAAETDDGLPF